MIIYKRIREKIELSMYNNFTIVEYFRKQGAQIGQDCYIAPRSLGAEPYLIKIGNHVAIAKGVGFHTHDGGTWIFREEIPDLRVFGPIVIEDNCIIGAFSQIFANVTIGRNSIVGAGSVVINDVPMNSIVMGVPARPFGSISKYREKCIERWAIQKPPNFHPDSIKHYETVEDPKVLLEQLRKHLIHVFEDKLK
jgi:acetyltransferase-like isoleucine patch superfamily enzyme